MLLVKTKRPQRRYPSQIKSLITGILWRHRHDIYRKQGTHNNCSGLLHLNKANRGREEGGQGSGGQDYSDSALFIEICFGIRNAFDGSNPGQDVANALTGRNRYSISLHKRSVPVILCFFVIKQTIFNLLLRMRTLFSLSKPYLIHLI